MEVHCNKQTFETYKCKGYLTIVYGIKALNIFMHCSDSIKKYQLVSK